jgi:hypothetical protein
MPISLKSALSFFNEFTELKINSFNSSVQNIIPWALSCGTS